MVLSLTVVQVSADNGIDAVSVFVNVSEGGKILSDKDGRLLEHAKVELFGKESYCLDDVFKALHDAFYEGGSDLGYSSAEGAWGPYVTKFWGDESGNFGYQVNGGAEEVMGLSHVVKNGDYIDACIFKSSYPDTESYTSFDRPVYEVYVNEEVTLILSQAGYDENYKTVFSPCEGAEITVNGERKALFTDKDGKASLAFDSPGTYTVSAEKEKEVNGETVTAITAPVSVVTVKAYPDACITVPSDASLFLGSKGKTHFVKFTEAEPSLIISDGEFSKYYFDLADNGTYNYRVSGDEYVTYGGTFKKTADFALNITEEMLKPEGKTKTTVDRDSSSNSGYNVADIYLNINAEGYLKLSKGDNYQIVSLRNWEAVNSTFNNYFIEPDYRYEVIDENGNPSDIVTVGEDGLLTAREKGTAIVLVTYDAMTLNFGSGDEFYGAVYPENTGVFVVTVDSGDSEINTGMTLNEGKNKPEMKLSGDKIDSEHDVIYFTGEYGKYTFTPKTEGVKVYALNPYVTEKISYNGFEEIMGNADGSVTVPLTEGRNIVKLEKDGKEEFQVITAKKVDVTVNNGEGVHPGDKVSVVFDKLYHPANKLAGVYNMNAVALYEDVTGYEGQVIGASSAQYNFANSASANTVSNIMTEKNEWGVIKYVKSGDLVIPEDYPYDTFVLSGGFIYVSGWGDPYGNHRLITYESGKGANINADAKIGYLGKLPDITIPVTITASPLTSVTLKTDGVKTEYYEGDKFDTEGLVVTANYEDETAQIALNYEISPEILTLDTDKVTVSYRGMTEYIPVSVKAPKVVGIEIKKAPDKTTYKEGETFSPSGMVVEAVYENGSRKETKDYSYSPNRELEITDTQVIVTYTGKEAAENIKPASQIINVSENTSGGGGVSASGKITVYFTLLGDEKHGEPEDSGDIHTKSKGNLETWIPKTKITLDKGSFVIDAVKKALGISGIPYTNEGDYISEIKGLSEFDNGSLSGWMYLLNGKYPDKGIDSQKLSDKDIIIFHYTDDYTKEKNEYSHGSSSSGSPTKKNDETVKESVENADETKKEDEKKPLFSENTYRDVKSSDWHYEAVKFAYENNIMQGTDKGFEPDISMTRAMFITVLWRMENKPSVNYAISFEDVNPDEWYAEAIRWAASENIISGISETVFGKDEKITREQTAAMLYRYIKTKRGEEEKENECSLSFEDAGNISDFALKAMTWAVNMGVIKGKTDRTINPGDNTTRAEAAEMIMRFINILTK